MAFDDEISSIGNNITGVFGRLEVSGIDHSINAVVLGAFKASGTEISGTVFVPQDVQVEWAVSGINISVRRIRRTWDELAQLAQHL